MNARTISFLLSLGFVGCSGDNMDGADANGTDTASALAGGDGAGASATCDNEPRAEEFTPGMTKQTDGGMDIALASADPAPPARLDNTWVLSVEDSDGEPVLGAQLTLDPQMPDHGHGSPREAVVTELGDGLYSAEPVALFMPGYWTVDVSVALGDEPTESVQFGFCVP